VPEAHYIDIFSPVLNDQGQPRPEFFTADLLYMNDAGYRLWQSVIAVHLPVAASVQ
jgi:hypothetical protein